MSKGIIKTAATLILVIAVAVPAFFYFNANKEEKITVDEGRINEVKTMVQLCTMVIYKEVPVLDTINNKVIAAIQKQQGSISFDIENLQIDTEGDTVKLTLPREIVEIRESTEDNSWQVIDTKNIGFLGAIRNDRLTDREENRVKAKLKRNSINKLYKDGTVRHARSEAAKNLQIMLERIYRKPVVVIDSNP